MTNFESPKDTSLMAAVNAVMDNLQAALGLADSVFFCECGRMGCNDRVTLTRSEYATLQDASQPVLVAAHAADRPSIGSVMALTG